MRINRRHFLQLSAATVAIGATTWTVPAEARPVIVQPVRKLYFHNPHTHETASATYFKHGHYDKKAMRTFNHILRDQRTGEVIHMDPELFDLLHRLQASLRNHSRIEVISGYRSPATNAWLASFRSGVAKHSYHMHGMALDLRIHGVPTSHIHKAALHLRAGGVGYYPDSDFVHVDTGPIRTW